MPVSSPAQPGAAGMDLSIAEVSFIGIGIGPTIIRKFAREVIFTQPGVTAIVTDSEERNGRSRRAFEKAGFIPMTTVQLKGELVRGRILHLPAIAGTRASRP
jgi:RimJ/RimL family protein N-acetyltransferase